MELKPYQQQILGDLKRFLTLCVEKRNTPKAFMEFWLNHDRTPLTPFPGFAVEPYKDNVKNTPHVCVKVPTAGGKTFIACNALRTIFDIINHNGPRAVVWLVPSVTILEQTLHNLQNPQHPYRKRINTNFGNRVAIFDKQQALTGAGFNLSCAQENLCILVMSFDSFRTNNKEGRKVYQENGYLQSFKPLIESQSDSVLPESFGETAEIDVQLMTVLQALRPVVIVDESHNAETDLSLDMLKNLHPSFILDLTATPRKNSNIISFTDALALKKENMVKLPVIVYNHQNKNDVISSALQLQRNLENEAKKLKDKKSHPIRPIVLFQAQPRIGDENTTFDKIKKILLELKIPDEQIKIKTADRNELKGINLLSPDCPVRYIITVNALKEGWDCPFAYILASLADKSSAVDVEQILGRVLRLPYVRQNESPLLNVCYVLTASAKFSETLDNIVKGLNRAGFSDQDYHIAESTEIETKKPLVKPEQPQFFSFPPAPEVETDKLDTQKIFFDPTDEPVAPRTDSPVSTIMGNAVKQNDEYIKKTEKNDMNQNIPPAALFGQVKTYAMKEVFRKSAEAIKLPQFHCKVPVSDLFGTGEELFTKDLLLQGFPLNKSDTNIDFDSVDSTMYSIDLDETSKDHTPTFCKVDGAVHERLVKYILNPANKSTRVRRCGELIMERIGSLNPITDRDIKLYIKHILEDFSDEQFADMLQRPYDYSNRIKQKIDELAQAYIEQQFYNQITTNIIFLEPSYSLPKTICPSHTSKPISKSLYEKEGDINGFEEQVIMEVAKMENVEFWTRNIDRKGFCINGFINHYPDFIIKTKNNVVLLETKGDHLDAASKIKLGNLWGNKAGNGFIYFMVYNERNVDGAVNYRDFLKYMKEL